MKPRHLRALSISLSSVCFAAFPVMGFGDSSLYKTPDLNVGFPLPARITGLGLVGDDAVLGGDGMVPVWGNPNHIWYIDAQAKTAFDSDWLGSLGTGLRSVYHDNSILGAYIFVDRNESPEHNTFWFVNPGVESLGQHLDFRANAYIPTSTKRQYGRTDWADNFGVYDYVSFSGHQQFDVLMNEDEEVGWGADAEIGGLIPSLGGTRAYVGGYHFNFQDADNINGVAARIEVPVNRYLGFTARDSYDNEQHNTFLVGIKLTLGGVNTHPRDPHQAIQARILDPIERNMATLGQGVGEPVQNVLTVVPPAAGPTPPPPLVERDNIWFFSPNGTTTFDGSVNTCTAENVCTDENFNQTTITGINTLVMDSTDINTDKNSTSPSFYLAPGDYVSLDGDNPLEFTNDWIFGRSEDFAAPELSATLTGAMIFNGNNNKLQTIILESDGNQDVGILLNAGSRLVIEGSTIGSMTLGNNYQTAIRVNDASLRTTDETEAGVFLAPTNIIAYGNNGNPVIGIDANYTSGLGSISLLGTNVTAATDLNESSSAMTQTAIALNLINAPAVNIERSTISATATFAGNQATGETTAATGIYANNSTVVINDGSTVEANATVTGNNQGFNMASAIGANGINEALPFEDNTFTISNSTIEAQAQINGDNVDGLNQAIGIGENLAGTIQPNPLMLPTPSVSGNTFTLNSTVLNSTASITGNNSSSLLLGTNQAAGLGANVSASANSGLIITDNEFTIQSTSTVTARATVGQTNSGLNSATGLGGNSFFSEAIFDDNEISVTGSTIQATAQVRTNNSFNIATGLGGNTFLGDSSFINNQITLNSSTISGLANVSTNNLGQNYAVGLGENSLSTVNNIFDNNTVDITGGSLTGTAAVGSQNSGSNMAAALGSNASSSLSTGFTNNSIIIRDAELTGSAEITSIQASTGINEATGIGGNADVFVGNTIQLTTSDVTGEASVGFGNDNINFAAGIGGNSTGSSSEFDNNTITVTGGSITATASLNDNNNLTGNNFAAGIGGNATTGNASFNDNTITLNDVTLTASANITGFNSNNNFVAGIGGNTTDFTGDASFNNNSINIHGGSITGTASIGENNLGNNFATGIGGNTDRGTVSFNDNTITIDEEAAVLAQAIITVSNATDKLNFATGLGGNSESADADASFNGEVSTMTNQVITINNASIGALASVGSGNIGANFAAGIGGNSLNGDSSFTDNTFNIELGTITANTSAENNFGISSATGFGANNSTINLGNGNVSFTDNIINIDNSGITATAIISGDNSGTNNAIGLGAQNTSNGNEAFIDNTLTVNLSDISAAAEVDVNSGSNAVWGINMTDANSQGTLSFIDTNITALASGVGLGANNATGLDLNSNTSLIATFAASTRDATLTATVNGSNAACYTVAGGAAVNLIDNPPGAVIITNCNV